jgi:hypothetical protein
LFQGLEGVVQGVQAFAQTFSWDKGVARGSLILFRLFKVFRLLPKTSSRDKEVTRGTLTLFRLFKLLRKLSWGAKKRHVASLRSPSYPGCSGCLGCSGFCTNFLTSQRSSRVRTYFQRGGGGWGNVQAVQAPAQTFSRGKKWHVAVSRCSGCSGCLCVYANFLTNTKVERGSLTVFWMFKLFRLLRKLSHDEKVGDTWQIHFQR